MADHDKDLDLQAIELPTAPEVSDNDFLVLKDVSSDAPLSKTKIGTMRTVFGSGYPNVQDLAEGDIVPPAWTLEGIDGAWRVTVTSVVPDAVCYIVYWFDAYITGEWIPAKEGGIWEFRENASEGVLQLTIRAPIEDPPVRIFRIFKIQSVSATEKGPLSEKKEAFTKIYLPEDFIPNQPSLDTTGGYPYITYYPMDMGHFAYTISMQILAPAGQKNYIKQYKILRATDSGTGSFDGTEPYVEIKGYDVKNKKIPPSKFPFIDTDADLTTGWKYRYQVVAIALNDKPSEPGGVAPNDYQETTLTDDTTAPDPPTFTVTTFATHFEIRFYNPYDEYEPPPTQNEGDPCPDWRYYLVCHKKEGDTGENSPPCTGCGGVGFTSFDMVENWQDPFVVGISAEDADKTLVFKAKAVDYSGNSSEWSPPSDPDKIKKVTGDIVDDRTIDAGHVILKALTYQEIADLTIQSEQLANLAITETKVGNLAIATPKLQANCVEAAKIAAAAIETGHLKALNVTGDKIAANAVNLSKLNFTPLTSAGTTGEIIATIMATSEELKISGLKLHITATTVFDSDVMIQGILVTAGGVRTGSGTTRMELGQWGSISQGALIGYHSDVAKLTVRILGSGEPRIQLVSGTYIANLKHGSLVLSEDGDTTVALVSTATYGEIQIGGASGNLRINGNKVVGARQSAVGQSAYSQGTVPITLDTGSDLVDRAGFNTKLATLKTHFDELSSAVNVAIGSINILLIRLGTAGHGLTADTV